MIHGFTSPEVALGMQDRLERDAHYDAIMERDAKKWEAQEDIKETKGLMKFMNDEKLAPGLAGIMSNLEGAAYELAKLSERSRPEEIVALKVVLQMCSRVERELFLMAMGE